MAALYGTIKGNRGEASRLGTKASGISARLETWQGAIHVYLEANGEFVIYMGDKGSEGRIVATGNIGDREREFHATATDGSPVYSIPSSYL